MLVLVQTAFTKFYDHTAWHYDPAEDKMERTLQAEYYDQYVDHFDNQNEQTFKQKYLVNDTYFKAGGPLVLFIGGEGPLQESTVGDRYSNEYFARELGGLKIALEHRFYGESFPEADSSNLTLLSSRQAVADVSMFIPFIKKEYQVGKVFLIGGSYAGNLVAWMRAQLPHMVDAALAVSAPVLAKVDYPEYFQHVEAELIKYGGEQCLGAMNLVSRYLDEKIEDPSSYETLASIFSCDLEEMKGYTELDRKVWVENIGTAIAGVVEYAKAAGFDGELEENEITTVCRGMTEHYDDFQDIEEILKDYAAALGISDQSNTGLGYSTMIDSMKITDLSVDQSMRSWMWQTCTEFGYYQTSTWSGSAFPVLNDLDTMMHMCYDVYFVDFMTEAGVKQVQEAVEDACYESNIWYGARHIPRDQIYYSHGTVDPWSELGIRDDLAWADGQFYGGKLLMIEEGSHCSDIYMNWTILDDVRANELKTIKEWLESE